MKRTLVMLLMVVAVAGRAALPELPPTPLTHPSAYRSPLEFFRKLLAMDAEGRKAALAGRSERARKVLERKLAEYDALSPGLRELRLQATELRYYLRPLLTLPPRQREISVAHLPEKFAGLIKARLETWDRLPGETRREIVENEWMLHAVLRYGPKFAAKAAAINLPVAEAEKAMRQLAAWQALSAEQQAAMIRRFDGFFSLKPAEQEKVLARLPEYQRAKVFATIEEIQQLPPAEREQCLSALRRFAAMSASQRIAFFSNAAQWRRLSELEKKSWRTVVKQFSEARDESNPPPLPPGLDSTPLAPIEILTAR